MKGELLLRALEILEEAVYTTADFIDAFLSSSKSNYLRLRNFQPRYHKTIAGQMLEAMKEKQRFYNILYQLQKHGLVEKEKVSNRRSSFWKITEKGKERLSAMSGKYILPPIDYAFSKSPLLVIVSFDVPEKEKVKREWLRLVLVRYGFQKLQKSVWIGKLKIPREFLEDLKKINLLSCVEIFAVTRTGTIKSVV